MNIMVNKLEDYGKSLDLASQIEEIKKVILKMDLDYVKEAAKKMIDQGNWQDAAAVLNPMSPLEKNDVLRDMGSALGKLAEFIELLKKIDDGKRKVREIEAANAYISKMFM